MSLASWFAVPTGHVCGVCAELADRTGVTPWVWRVGAILLALTHPMVGVLIYALLAMLLRRTAGVVERDSRAAVLERRFTAAMRARRW